MIDLYYFTESYKELEKALEHLNRAQEILDRCENKDDDCKRLSNELFWLINDFEKYMESFKSITKEREQYLDIKEAEQENWGE